MRNSLMLVLAVFFAGVSSAVAQESKLTEQQKSQLIKRFPKSDANKDGKLGPAKSQETKAYEADTCVYGEPDSEITATGERDRPLLGVQRWDMFSGKGATQQKELGYLPGKQGFLKDSQWHDRVPFFCRLTKDVDWVEHPANAGPLWFNYPFSQQLLQESMDQELRYACNAGIDFFVYHGPARKLFANGWELRNNFDCHMASKVPEAKRVNFTWALYAHRAIGYTRSKVAAMMDETIEYIKMPNWQTVMDGRPMIIVYHPERFRSALQVAQGKEQMTGTDFVEYIRARVDAAGLKNPYVVGCMEPRNSFMHAKTLKEEGYDAFMDYEGAYGGTVAKRDEAPTYAAATEEILKTCEQEYLNRGLPFLPPCPSMHYRWPHAFDRKGQPVEELHHFQWPKEGDLESRVKAVLDFVATHPKDCDAQTVIMYSWNEHSGGGGICPTMGKSPEYKPVTQWLDEVAEALATWKYPQESSKSMQSRNSGGTSIHAPSVTLAKKTRGAESSLSRPNILFIVSDDHGWGDLPSNWDKTEVQLPTLEALAAKGVRFPNYHTVPLCGPSRACMFTGQYSSENGMWRGPGNQPLGSPGYRGIKRDVKMLSEHLSQAGYKTGAFGKWHMGELEGEVPNDRGFDEFRGFLKGAHPYWVNENRSKMMHNRQPDRTSKGHATELFTQWAEKFIRENAAKDDPFFCYLTYNAVHGPLRVDESKPASAPEAWVKKALDRGVSFLRSDYVAILEHMDHNIGRLVDVLNELDIAENTLIVFVSDNGGCTMEENAAGGRFPGNNGPYQGGKATTYQGGLNVPFLVNWKGRLPQGMVSDEQVMHCDVFATLLEAATIPVPEMNGKNPVRGVSLMPHMLSTGKETIPERTMIFELWGNIGLRKGDYKLWSEIGREHSPDWDALAAELKRTDLALFDLSKDVAEKNDLRTDLPEVYTSLKTELIDHFSNINSEYPGGGSSETLKSEKSKAQKTATTPAPKRPSPDQFFKSRDRNGDGAITLEEYIGNPKGRNVPALTKRFKKIDSNGDGKLQLDELKK